MSSILKGGWHPKGKDGAKESWRGDFKGIDQIAGKFGKGRSTTDEKSERENHVSRPLTSLRDPSTFGPPPKHSAYYGNASSTTTSSNPSQRPTGPTSLGGAIPRETIEQQQQQAAWQAQQEAEEEEKPPPGPYQVNTTGLSTANLPKPPVRRPDTTLPPPPPRSARSSPAPPPRTTALSSPPPPTTGPKLPPRLPPRQNSRPDLHTPDPPPSYNASSSSVLSPDPSALGRLTSAGVSVPGLDIGTRPSRPHHTTPPGAPQAQQVNELQSRFRTMQFGAPSPPSPAPSQHQHVPHTPSPPLHSSNSFSTSSSTTGGGAAGSTTWEQKRQAATTAAAFHKDPASVSLGDARAAATTANSFRERHGEQVKSGYASAKGLSEKYGDKARDANARYGISERARGFASSAGAYNRSTPGMGSVGVGGTGSTTTTGMGGGMAPGQKKVAPPPPPPKKKELSVGGGGGGNGGIAAGDGPPPVPLSSKPR